MRNHQIGASALYAASRISLNNIVDYMDRLWSSLARAVDAVLGIVGYLISLDDYMGEALAMQSPATIGIGIDRVSCN